MQHYMWMVDLLGHAVYLHDAKDLNKTMSCEPNSFVWMTFSMLAEFMVSGEGIAETSSRTW